MSKNNNFEVGETFANQKEFENQSKVDANTE
jgi:hypothetical protein